MLCIFSDPRLQVPSDASKAARTLLKGALTQTLGHLSATAALLDAGAKSAAV